MVGQGGEYLFTPDDCRHPIPPQMKELKQVLKEWALGGSRDVSKFWKSHQTFAGNV